MKDHTCNECPDCGGCTRNEESMHQLCSRCGCSRARARKLFLLLPVLLLLALQACASIADPGPDFVPVRSTPSGATVTADGVEQGKTPCIAVLQRHKPGVLKFTLDEFAPVTVQRSKVVSPWILGDFLIDFCTLSLLIDIAAGNSTRHSRDEVNVVLRKPADGISEWVQPSPPPRTTSRR